MLVMQHAFLRAAPGYWRVKTLSPTLHAALVLQSGLGGGCLGQAALTGL